MPFPYLSVKINALLLWIALILGTLNILLVPAITGASGLLIVALLRFIGVFLTGWALIGFGVAKQMLPAQKDVALFFAAVLLVGVFGVLVTFHLGIV